MSKEEVITGLIAITKDCSQTKAIEGYFEDIVKEIKGIG